jgi:hypothetical protein
MRVALRILAACAAVLPILSQARTPASPAWPFGPPKTRVRLEGFVARSDGETLSIELPDERVIRLRLDEKTQYRPETPPDNLESFRVADLVEVQSEVDGRGLLLARSIHFVRAASAEERAEVVQNPEMMHAWRRNDLRGTATPADDDRRLRKAVKPAAIDSVNETGDELIARIRRKVDDAFDEVPRLRSKQVTSLFHSTSKPLKWVPEGVVAVEIEYEDGFESYSNIRVNGRKPSTAPETADPDYMRSFDKAWSTGDFESIAHCIFSELQDSDFTKAGVERNEGIEVARYNFTGRRSSGCIGMQYRSEVVYPSYKGVLEANAETGELLHVELEATDIPSSFPMDRAERSVDFHKVRAGAKEYLLPATAYWFGCFRNSYSCFLNRIDFRDYRRFESDSIVRFDTR